MKGSGVPQRAGAGTGYPRSTRWAWAGALIGLLAGLVGFAPAGWLASAVSIATDERLQLQDARGSLWQGSARWVLGAGTGTRDAAALPGRIAWSVSPSWDGAVLRLDAPCCAQAPVELRLERTWSAPRLRVSDTVSRWPAALLAGLGAPWNTVRPEGDLQVLPQGLSVEWSEGRWRLQGALQVDALAMSSRLSTLRPIGSYRVALQGAQGGNPPRLRLETLEGSLQMQGQGEWLATGWRFRGEASAAPDSEAALSNLLNILGRRAGPRSIISLG